MEECVNVWAEGNKSPDSCAIQGEELVHAPEFAQAEERMAAIVTMPKED